MHSVIGFEITADFGPSSEAQVQVLKVQSSTCTEAQVLKVQVQVPMSFDQVLVQVHH